MTPFAPEFHLRFAATTSVDSRGGPADICPAIGQIG
jgi:hypothetical protein